MVVLLLTFLAGKVIYDEHKGRKIRKARKAEAKAEALEAQYHVVSEAMIVGNSVTNPLYVAGEQDFDPPAHHKDVQTLETLTSQSLVSFGTFEIAVLPEKNPGRFVVA